MTLERRRLPALLDKARLCDETSLSSRAVDAWVRQGALPSPRLIRGKLMWRGIDVERCIDGYWSDTPASAPSEAQQQEDIRRATERAVRGVA